MKQYLFNFAIILFSLSTEYSEPNLFNKLFLLNSFNFEKLFSIFAKAFEDYVLKEHINNLHLDP